jgi:hypothetical protein
MLEQLQRMVAYLERVHSSYTVEINSVATLNEGWAVTFTITGREGMGLEGREYQRIAFFKRDGRSLASCQWDSICS